MSNVLQFSGLLILIIASLFLGLKLRHHSQKQRQLAQSQFQQLKQRVTRLRLSRMLAFLGADLDEYLKNVPREEIEKHIRNCEGCKALDSCDDCLQDGKAILDMNFCPNYRSLTQHSKTLAHNRLH